MSKESRAQIIHLVAALAIALAILVPMNSNASEKSKECFSCLAEKKEDAIIDEFLHEIKECSMYNIKTKSLLYFLDRGSLDYSSFLEKKGELREIDDEEAKGKIVYFLKSLNRENILPVDFTRIKIKEFRPISSFFDDKFSDSQISFSCGSKNYKINFYSTVYIFEDKSTLGLINGEIFYGKNKVIFFLPLDKLKELILIMNLIYRY